MPDNIMFLQVITNHQELIVWFSIQLGSRLKFGCPRMRSTLTRDLEKDVQWFDWMVGWQCISRDVTVKVICPIHYNNIETETSSFWRNLCRRQLPYPLMKFHPNDQISFGWINIYRQFNDTEMTIIFWRSVSNIFCEWQKNLNMI